MEALSFSKMPHYHFSANRQFEPGECHMNRIYGLSVLLIVRKGVLRFSENGVPIEVKGGEYYIQQPNLLQQGIVPSDEPNYFFVHFRGHYSVSGALPLRGRFDIDKIQPIIEELELLGISAERIEYETVFYKLLIALKNGETKISDAETIRKYLLNHYESEVDLNKIAKISALSKNQVINVFKKKYNVTPYQFLLDFRLEKASEMILATDIPIGEICFMSGFTDYTAFYKSFKRKYDVSPFEYRENHSASAVPDKLYFNRKNNREDIKAELSHSLHQKEAK